MTDFWHGFTILEYLADQKGAEFFEIETPPQKILDKVEAMGYTYFISGAQTFIRRRNERP